MRTATTSAGGSHVAGIRGPRSAAGGWSAYAHWFHGGGVRVGAAPAAALAVTAAVPTQTVATIAATRRVVVVLMAVPPSVPVGTSLSGNLNGARRGFKALTVRPSMWEVEAVVGRKSLARARVSRL